MPGGTPPPNQQVPSASVQQAHQHLRENATSTVLVDVREVDEFQQGHAAGAKNIPLSEFVQRADEVPSDRDVLLICRSGARSMQAAMYLRQQRGHARVTNVSGGTEAWEKAGLPMER